MKNWLQSFLERAPINSEQRFPYAAHILIRDQYAEEIRVLVVANSWVRLAMTDIEFTNMVAEALRVSRDDVELGVCQISVKRAERPEPFTIDDVEALRPIILARWGWLEAEATWFMVGDYMPPDELGLAW